MSRSSDVGYLIVLDLADELCLCVDDARLIRSIYRTAHRAYFSPYELWCNHRGYGVLVGDFASGNCITAIGNHDRVLRYDGVDLRNVPVFLAAQVRISELLAHPSVVGIESLLADAHDS